MTESSAAEKALVDEFAAIYDPYLPRIATRMLALLAIDGGELTSQELMARLDVSAASVSSMGRLLIKLGDASRRVDPETRRDLFSIRPDAWTYIWGESRTRNLRIADWAERAIELVGGPEEDHPSLVDLREFAAFLADEIPRLYERYRAEHPQPAEPGRT